jgi:Flp pilus assembly protein TadG
VKKGQALVEFALVSMLFLILVLGIVDFGYLFMGRVTAYQATRVAARFAATHPTAWTNAANPASNTIAGTLKLTAVPARVPNDDAHLTIRYYVAGAGAPVLCGAWSAAANAFQPQAGYTQATCVVPGSLIRIQANYLYTFITPLLKATYTSVTISTDASVLEEQ